MSGLDTVVLAAVVCVVEIGGIFFSGMVLGSENVLVRVGMSVAVRGLSGAIG